MEWHITHPIGSLNRVPDILQCAYGALCVGSAEIFYQLSNKLSSFMVTLGPFSAFNNEEQYRVYLSQTACRYPGYTSPFDYNYVAKHENEHRKAWNKYKVSAALCTIQLKERRGFAVQPFVSVNFEDLRRAARSDCKRLARINGEVLLAPAQGGAGSFESEESEWGKQLLEFAKSQS